MSTGVDAQTCRVIVLDQTIQSMTEFKQIIGRGTRIREDYGKLYFTILDLKKATELFADPGFDGDPVRVYEPKDGETVAPPDDEDDSALPPDETQVSTDPVSNYQRRIPISLASRSRIPIASTSSRSAPRPLSAI